MKYEPSSVTSIELIDMIEKSLNVSVNNFENLRSFVQDTSGKRRFSSEYNFPDMFQFFDLGAEKKDYLIEFNGGVIENIQVITQYTEVFGQPSEIESWLRDKAKLHPNNGLEFLTSYNLDVDIDESNIDTDEEVNIWVKRYFHDSSLNKSRNGYLYLDGEKAVFSNKELAIEYIDAAESAPYVLAENEFSRPSYHLVAVGEAEKQ